MTLATLTERRSMLSVGGEIWVFPGGETATGRTVQAPVDTLGVRGKRMVVRFTVEDSDHLQLGDQITRQSTGAAYVIRDFQADGFQAFRVLILEAL